MARTLARGPVKAAIAIAATAVALALPGHVRAARDDPRRGCHRQLRCSAAGCSALPLTLAFPIGRRTAIVCAQLLVLLFFVPLWLADALSSHSLRLFDSFYGAGALVFGGGHVVLPLLNEAVVAPGWVSQQAFLAGYGAAQAVPGPLFTFSAYLGAIEDPSPNGVAGAAIALVAIFLPSFLLLGAALPLWSAARERTEIQAAVAGIGAAVVGLLAAALWDPVLSTSVHDGERRRRGRGAVPAARDSCRRGPSSASPPSPARSCSDLRLRVPRSRDAAAGRIPLRQQERSIDVTRLRPIAVVVFAALVVACIATFGLSVEALVDSLGCAVLVAVTRHRFRAAHRAEQDHRAGARRRARRPDDS